MSRFSAMRSGWTSKSLELPKETSCSPPRAGELDPGTEPCRTCQAPLHGPQSLVGISHCCCDVGPHGGWKMDKMTSKGPRVMWLPWWGQNGDRPGWIPGPSAPQISCSSAKSGLACIRLETPPGPCSLG